ncbi:hypothetical protein [Absidia glauca]|uniref:Integrase zinc-binding domain-containing protein n=1 Tax=Absidia glauca TaxID=4829 RepID=A0A163KKI2_ABSGL|nr:hypothetical protein [Absidia glauca]
MNGPLYSSTTINMYAEPNTTASLSPTYDPSFVSTYSYKPSVGPIAANDTENNGHHGPCLCYKTNTETPMDTTSTRSLSALSSPSSTSTSSFSSSSPSLLSPSSTDVSSLDMHYIYDQDQYPSPQTFDTIVQDYLQNLSTKKRDKALVDQHRYDLILQVLKDPRNTAISTAQFRFWVKKMFQLVSTTEAKSPMATSTTTNWTVYHDDKPVAMQEQIYPILIQAHREAHHGGRDKTSALVRKRYSWIPKELIARFVRRCPFCISRRNGHISRPTRPSHQPTLPKSPPSTINKSAPCPDNQSTLKSNSLTNHYHPYHLNGSRPSWKQPMGSSATSIAASAAASAVSTQWIEPGTTPFYYYSHHPSSSSSSSPSSRDFLDSPTDRHDDYTPHPMPEYSISSSPHSGYMEQRHYDYPLNHYVVPPLPESYPPSSSLSSLYGMPSTISMELLSHH